MSYDVIRDIEQFSGEPITVTLFHGTTHHFDSFNGDKVNSDNMFGRQIYLTSSEYDAHKNYSNADGPDLRNRIEHEAEKYVNDNYDDEDYAHDDGVAEAKKWLYGGKDQVLTVDVTIRNPLILGKNKPHGITPVNDDMYHEASVIVADKHGVSLDFIWEDGEYEDLIYEEMDRMQMEGFDRFCSLLNNALSVLKSDLDHADAHQILYQLFCESETAEQVFKIASSDERYLYLFSDETGMNNIKPVVAEIFHQHGCDCIVLLNAEEACRNMDMEPNTMHIAMSLDNLSQLTIVDRLELFDEVGGPSM